MKHLLPLLIAALALPACTHHHQGKPGTDGQDGVDGPSAVDTVNFDFIRNIDESIVSGSYWIGDARLVLPPAILAAAPADPDREGLILYLGLARYLLTATRAGEYCVVDRPDEVLGQLDFTTQTHLAIIELSTLDALGLILELADKGIVVESSEIAILDAKRTELRIGAVRIRIIGGN